MLIKPYRIPKHKDIMRSFGYMETASGNNKNVTSHEDDNGNVTVIHHPSTNWAHIDNKNKTIEGKGINTLKDHLLKIHNNFKEDESVSPFSSAVNCAGSGNINGIGIGLQGEPGIKKKKFLREILKRKENKKKD